MSIGMQIPSNAKTAHMELEVTRADGSGTEVARILHWERNIIKRWLWWKLNGHEGEKLIARRKKRTWF